MPIGSPPACRSDLRPPLLLSALLSGAVRSRCLLLCARSRFACGGNNIEADEGSRRLALIRATTVRTW